MYRLRFSQFETIDVKELSQYHLEYADAGVITIMNLDTNEMYMGEGVWASV